MTHYGSYKEYLLETTYTPLFRGDVGGLIGLQYEWQLLSKKLMSLEVRYNHGLKQFTDLGRNKSAELTIGYQF